MDKLWYYAVSGSSEKQGPIPEDQIRALIQSGELHPNDLVWSDGMANWTALAQVTELQGAAPADAPPSAPMAKAFPATTQVATGGPSGIPQGLEGWMTFVGVMSIIGGVFNCLSCVGIIWGVFMIIAGTSLLGAKNALGLATGIPADLAPFFDKLKTSMQMTGIFYIISIVGMVIWFIFFFGGMMSALSAAGLQQP